MKIKYWILGTIALFFWSSALLAREAILVQFSGTVEVQSQDAAYWRKAVKNLMVKQGEKVRTGKRSKAVLLFQDGSRTTLSQETVLIMSQLDIPVNIEQVEGKTRNKVKKLGKGFVLKTPTAVCSVRGTDFSVEIGEGGVTQLDVFEGTVNGLKLMTGESRDVSEGERLLFTPNPTPLGSPQPGEPAGEESAIKQLARKEVSLDMSREELQAAVAEEMRLAEYQEGKSLIDVNGSRVRVEEYILRKPKDVAEVDREKAFKFVVLNLRGNRIDFFTYKGIFRQPYRFLHLQRHIQQKVAGRPLRSVAERFRKKVRRRAGILFTVL
ncbi:MAG: FecR domain-containing protein [Elusimicrobia bacterium]|nr:FecR domain-containing protein [Elusimicrobiota bacterium]